MDTLILLIWTGPSSPTFHTIQKCNESVCIPTLETGNYTPRWSWDSIFCIIKSPTVPQCRAMARSYSLRTLPLTATLWRKLAIKAPNYFLYIFILLAILYKKDKTVEEVVAMETDQGCTVSYSMVWGRKTGAERSSRECRDSGRTRCSLPAYLDLTRTLCSSTLSDPEYIREECYDIALGVPDTKESSPPSPQTLERFKEICFSLTFWRFALCRKQSILGC